MALNYLLSPEFQIVSTAGKPASGGYLEVFVSGSRERYYCASDFNGTLYPFQVPLDSLGSNVVLADDSQAYDVYVYNRYGGELMSRYNVHPGAGGGIGINDITSSDGSLIVTETANGVDLRVNSTPPSILRATAETLYMDSQFTFAEAQRDGQNAIVDSQGKIIVNEGWWHYDATVKLRWTGPEQNETQSVSLYTHNASDSLTFDMSFPHNETVQVSGEYKALNDSTQFILGVTGVPSGMSVELVDFGIHSIIGEGAGGSYDAGNGIVINEADRIISIDPDVVQEKLTAGSNITIADNVISATAEPQVQADWAQSDSTAVDYIKNKPDLSVYATQTDLTNGLATKQDVISDLATIRAGAAAGATAVQDADYVHTDENFTTADKTKLSGIETGAEVNVQSNWAESDSSSDAYIQNKPSIPTATSDLNNDSGYITSADVPGAQEQSDWTETNSSDPAYILHKPATKQLVAGANITITDSNNNITISASTPSVPVQDVQVGGTSVVNAQGIAEVPRQVNADWTSSAGASEILNKPTLATVATSGSYTDLSNTPDLSQYATTTDLAGKADKVTGATNGDLAVLDSNGNLTDTGIASANLVHDASYVHTDENFTSAEKTKLSGIAANAEVNVQADWTETNTASDAYIANKPTNLVQDANYVHTDENFTSAEKTKLSGISAGAEVNVQANWNETDSSSDAYIQNKPSLATVATSGSYTDLSNTPSIPTATSDLTNDSGYITLSDVPAQVQADWNESDTNDPAYIQNKPTIPSALSAGNGIDITSNVVSAKVDGSTVTINASGELQAAPAITVDQTYNASSTNPQSGTAVADALSDYTPTSSLATVATSGSYTDLSNTPSIPTATSDLTNDSGYITLSDVPAQVQSDWNESDTSDPAYIQNKPTIPVLPTMKELVAGSNINLSEGTTTVTISATATAQVQSDWTEANTSNPAYIQHKPNLATVATSGSYNDLSSRPDIKPVVAGSNITITETANDFTIAASVPVIGTITV